MTRTRWPWYGLAFGCLLFVFAFGGMGAGHGSALPFALFSAPISLLPVVGFFSAPLWWTGIGWMLKEERRKALALLMALHTIAVGVVLWLGTPGEPGVEQWRYFRITEQAMPVWLWSGISVYVIGFVSIWILVLMPSSQEADGQAAHGAG